MRQKALENILSFKTTENKNDMQSMLEDIKILIDKCNFAEVAMFQPKKKSKPLSEEENDVVCELSTS